MTSVAEEKGKTMSEVRLIDANALMEKIKASYDLFEGCEYIGDKARRDELSSVMARIINAPTIEPKQEWIPCEERLPEAMYGESDNVIATCRHRSDVDGSAVWIKLLYFDGGNWCYPTGECYTSKVIAWMPLPAPYTEDSSTVEQTCETCKHYTVVSVACDRCDKRTHSRYERSE